MTDQARNDLPAKIAQAGRISVAEARRLLADIYKDGVVVEAEAALMIDLNRRIAGADDEWDARFVTVMSDFALRSAAPKGRVAVARADWLIARLRDAPGGPAENELETVLTILEKADAAPQQLVGFALEELSRRILSDGFASADNVERMRRALFAAGGDGATWVTRLEAHAMFVLNDAIGFADNDPAWDDLFARAVANHLLATAHPAPESEADALAREAWFADTTPRPAAFLGRMAASFVQPGWFERVSQSRDAAIAARLGAAAAAERNAGVDRDETRWLLSRFDEDKRITPGEAALIALLAEASPGFAQGLAAIAA